MIHALLAKVLAPKAADMLAPVVKLGGIALAALALFQCGVSEGKEAKALQLERAMNDELRDAQDKFIENSKVSQESYARALDILTELKTNAPQIIRDIHDAPATDCSNVLISDDEWLRLRRAFAVSATDRAIAGGPADRTPALHDGTGR